MNLSLLFWFLPVTRWVLHLFHWMGKHTSVVFLICVVLLHKFDCTCRFWMRKGGKKLLLFLAFLPLLQMLPSFCANTICHCFSTMNKFTILRRKGGLNLLVRAGPLKSLPLYNIIFSFIMQNTLQMIYIMSLRWRLLASGWMHLYRHQLFKSLPCNHRKLQHSRSQEVFFFPHNFTKYYKNTLLHIEHVGFLNMEITCIYFHQGV